MEETSNDARYEYSDQSSKQDDALKKEADISTVRPLQALERIMQRHPSLWDRSSIEGLFLELEELELGEGVPDRIRDTAQHVRKALLEPLVRLSLAQDKLLQEERQMSMEKKQQASLAMVILIEERNMAIQQFQEEFKRREKQTTFSETLLRDMDEMAKALDHSRQAATQAKQLLAAKEAEVQRLVGEKRMLLNLIMEAGPWELWEWVKQEIVVQGLEPGPNFEKKWLEWVAANEKLISADPNDIENSLATSIPKTVDEVVDSSLSTNWLKNMDDARKRSLLWIIFSIVLQEGMSNLRYVLEKGLFFLPMAWFYFWIGLSSRITRCVTGDIISRVKRSPLAFAFHLI
ncbi:hypothetical protein Mapa_009815 [Marchantia paleacea]|nr:hypothetical protein Mapa_009815 [Marchantia paleacea]